jgi:exopolysaccharide production protein ExoZ
MYFYVITAASIFIGYPLGPILSIAWLIAGVLLGLIVFPGYHLWTDPLLLNFVVGSLIAMLFYTGVVLTLAGRAAALVIAASLLYLSPFSGPFVRFFTYGPAIGLLVATLALRSDTFSMGKAGRIFVWLGSRSYTLYLSHIPILKVIEKSAYRLLPELHPEAYLVFAPLIALAVCELLFRMIEEPLTNRLKGLLRNASRYHSKLSRSVDEPARTTSG